MTTKLLQCCLVPGFLCLAAGMAGADESMRYEVIGLDEADYPRYDGGWSSGSGAEVEFSGWRLFSEGKESGNGDGESFALEEIGESKQLALLGTKRVFRISSRGGEPSYAQRLINQKMEKDDIFSVSMLVSGEGGEGGIVIGRETGDNSRCAAVAVIGRGDRLTVVDGDGTKDIDLSPGADPVGISFVFSGDGTYTLQVNGMGEGGKIFDLGPRRARGEAADGRYTAAFFATGGASLFFDDIQMERLVR